jgi:hypothetical protein
LARDPARRFASARQLADALSTQLACNDQTLAKHLAKLFDAPRPLLNELNEPVTKRPRKRTSAKAHTLRLAPPIAPAWPSVPPPAEPESFVVNLPLPPRQRPLGSAVVAWAALLSVILLIGGTSWAPHLTVAPRVTRARATVQAWIASSRAFTAQRRASVARRIAALHAPFGQVADEVAGEVVAEPVIVAAPVVTPAPAKVQVARKHVTHHAPVAHKKKRLHHRR